MLKKYENELIVGVCIYVTAMVLQPIYISGGDLSNVMKTWHDWQSWNAAVLAFLSALIFFQVRITIDNNRRGNKARAARAFLSHHLSILLKVCDDNLEEIVPILEAVNTAEKKNSPLPTTMALDVIPFGEEHFNYFKESIELEESDLSSELSELLQWMQIIEARLESLKVSLMDLTGVKHLDFSARRYFMDIACLKVRLERIYSYARGLSDEFHKPELSFGDVASATFGINNLPVENYLSEYAKLYIEEKKYFLKDETKS